MRFAFSILAAAIGVVVVSSCAKHARLDAVQTTGPSPTLPPPEEALVPEVKISPAVGWKAGEKPTPAPGVRVTAFATGLVHPRWLYVLPNGDVLVAETNRPPTPDPENPIREAFMKKAFRQAGADVKSPNRITLLRDKDGDGVAETKSVLLSNLFSPFGMALVGKKLYIANADALVWVPYATGATQIAAAPTRLAALPGTPRNHHWTKSLVATPDGSKFYVGVGSNSNIADHGMDIEANRAAILEIDAKTGKWRVFASGLRNPVGLAWAPGTKTLFAVVNERDELGPDLVPDYLTSVKDGAFYGWPWSYYGQHVDARVVPERPDMVAKAIRPDYALGPHVASLGLAFSSGRKMPEAWRNGAFVGLHGSWNRDPPSGYKVVFVPFVDGKPTGAAQDVLTGFRDAEGNARGRPVGVAMAKDGALLVADDVGNVVWRVAP
jgi:glucose/arabinose dehydrogenase